MSWSSLRYCSNAPQQPRSRELSQVSSPAIPRGKPWQRRLLRISRNHSGPLASGGKKPMYLSTCQTFVTLPCTRLQFTWYAASAAFLSIGQFWISERLSAAPETLSARSAPCGRNASFLAGSPVDRWEYPHFPCSVWPFAILRLVLYSLFNGPGRLTVLVHLAGARASGLGSSSCTRVIRWILVNF